MPSDLSKDDIPIVTYKSKQPIRSKLFNYKKFIKSSTFDITKPFHHVTVKINHLWILNMATS